MIKRIQVCGGESEEKNNNDTDHRNNDHGLDCLLSLIGRNFKVVLENYAQ